MVPLLIIISHYIPLKTPLVGKNKNSCSKPPTNIDPKLQVQSFEDCFPLEKNGLNSQGLSYLPSGYVKIAMENGKFSLIYPLKMGGCSIVM